MLESVRILDLTCGESTSRRNCLDKPRLRICRFVPERKELRFEWMSEEALSSDGIDIVVNGFSTRMVHLDMTCEIQITHDTEQDELNLTANVFGIRAFGKCYAFQKDGSNISPYSFPDLLRKWSLLEYMKGNEDWYDNFNYHALDLRFLGDSDERRIQRMRQNVLENEFISQTPYNIQYLYEDMGYTSMTNVIAERHENVDLDDDDDDDDYEFDEADEADDEVLVTDDEYENDGEVDELDEFQRESEFHDGDREVSSSLPLMHFQNSQHEDIENDDHMLMNASFVIPESVDHRTAQRFIGLLLQHLGQPQGAGAAADENSIDDH